MKKNSPQTHLLRHKDRHILGGKILLFTLLKKMHKKSSLQCSEYWHNWIITKLPHLLANCMNIVIDPIYIKEPSVSMSRYDSSDQTSAASLFEQPE